MASLFLRRTFLFLALVCGLSACLTIEENYTFKRDGSGSMEYVIDLSEMAELMKGLPGGNDTKDEGGGMDLAGDLSAIKGIPGIRKVKLKKEKDGFVQRLSFRFADIRALNAALNRLMPDSTDHAHEFFRWEGNTLVRTNNRHALELGGGFGGDPGDSTGMDMMLQSMHYRYALRFSDEVGDVQLADGVYRKDGDRKTLELDTDWSVISKVPGALDFRVTVAR